jgi:hypothetical protein
MPIPSRRQAVAPPVDATRADAVAADRTPGEGGCRHAPGLCLVKPLAAAATEERRTRGEAEGGGWGGALARRGAAARGAERLVWRGSCEED